MMDRVVVESLVDERKIDLLERLRLWSETRAQQTLDICGF
jgi:hypothetical protein